MAPYLLLVRMLQVYVAMFRRKSACTSALAWQALPVFSVAWMMVGCGLTMNLGDYSSDQAPTDRDAPVARASGDAGDSGSGGSQPYASTDADSAAAGAGGGAGGWPQDVDDCDPEPCVHGTCSDGANSYSCSCDAGWTGTDCNQNIDDCNPNPCVHGTCSDGVNSYSCSCDAGWSGANCDLCVDNCGPSIEVVGTGHATIDADLTSFELTTNLNTLGASKLIVTVSGEKGWVNSPLPNTFADAKFGGLSMIKAAEEKADALGVAAIFFMDNPPVSGGIVISTGVSFNSVHGSWLAVKGTQSGKGAVSFSASSATTTSLLGSGDSLVVAAIHNDAGNVPVAASPLTPLLSSNARYSEGAAGYQVVSGSTATSPFSNAGPTPVTLAVEFPSLCPSCP